MDFRANRIARTEVLTAMSLGKEAAFRNASSLIPGLKKVWISAGDPRTRDAHTSSGVDGQIRDNDKAFSNGLQFPRDPSGPPAEVINCRCDILMLPPSQSFRGGEITGG